MLLLKSTFLWLALVAAPLVVAQTPPFGFGSSSGDTSTPPGDDISSVSINLPRPITFLGDIFTNVYQNTNGHITFGIPFPEEFSGFIPSSEVPAMAAIFWTDIDTTNDGAGQNKLWIRAAANTADLNLSRQIIAGAGVSFSPTAVIVATWLNVDPYTGDDDGTDDDLFGLQNTFQLVMAYDGAGTTWAIFAYTQIEFTKNAVIGFNGDKNLIGETITTVSDSTIGNNLLIDTNCGRPGVYAFQVNDRVKYNCGPGFLDGQTDIFPFQGPVEGGTVVQFNNLPECLNNAAVDVYCKFENDEFSLTVKGVRVFQNAVECVTPYAGAPTTASVSYTVVTRGAILNPNTASWISVSRPFQFFGQKLGLEISDSVPTTVMEAGDSVNIVWDAAAIRQEAFDTLSRIDGSVTLRGITSSIQIFAYNSDQLSFTLLQTIPVTKTQTSLSLTVPNNLIRNYYLTENIGDVAVVLVRLVASFGSRVGATRSLDLIGILPPGQLSDDVPQNVCNRYLTPKASCPDDINNLPPCPPTQNQTSIGFQVDSVCPFPDGCDFFHPEAAGCYRAMGSSGAGQQCCYASGGGLIVDPFQGAGTADCISRDGGLSNAIGHFLADVVPFFICCKLTDSCGDFYTERPSDNGSRYENPRAPSMAFGDPHFRTFDGLEYDFNGAGEFIAFCGRPTGNLFTFCNPTTRRLGRGTLSVHLRLVPIGTGSASGTKTVAAAIEDPLHVSAVALVPHPDRRLDVYDGSTLVEFPFTNESTETVLFPDGLMITRTADVFATTFNVKVTTPSGLVLEISEAYGVMLPSITLPASFISGRGVGLFGRVDGNQVNDFTTSSGTIATIDSTSARNQQIFDRFGSTWMIRSNVASLFKALSDTEDQSWSNFYNPDYRPSFVAPSMSGTLLNQANSACNAIQSTAIRNGCRFDIAVTQDVTTFGAAAQAAVAQQAVINAVRNNPPKFTSPDVSVELIDGISQDFPFSATDSDGNPISFSLERNDDKAFTLLANRRILRFLGSTLPGIYVGWVGASDGVAQTLFQVSVTVSDIQNADPTALMLVDSQTNKFIDFLGTTATVNYTSIKSSTSSLNINASFAPGIQARSVRVTFNRPYRNVCETSAPFSVFGDSFGDFNDVKIQLGSHVATATPYSQSNCNGPTAGETLTSAINAVGCKVGLFVYNSTSANTNRSVANNDVLQNIRCAANFEVAVQCGFNIGFVRMRFRNADTFALIQDLIDYSAPYFLYPQGSRQNIFAGRNGRFKAGRYFVRPSIDGILHPRIYFDILRNCVT